MGIIKKENDESFWLGADVGQTESISHIPTQITSYKGINAPLNNWEYSFLKGYLLRCGQKSEPNRVLVFPYHPYASGAYIQNAKNINSSCRYILLNSSKNKIDKNGNELPETDKTYFYSSVNCNLIAGTYYYREIQNGISQLIEEDIPFVVINSDEEQVVYIGHELNMVRVYYTSTYEEGNLIGDVTPYIDYKSSVFTYYYYEESDTLSFNYSLIPPICIRCKYDVTAIELNGNDITNEFDMEWQNGTWSQSSRLSNTFNCGITQIDYGARQGGIVNQNGNIFAHRQQLNKTEGTINNTKIEVPAYYNISHNGNTYRENMKTYFPIDDGKYECDIKWDEIVNIGEYDSSVKHGYIISHNTISGTISSKYTNVNSTKQKNTHYYVTSDELVRTTLLRTSDEESVVWSTTWEDRHIKTGGDVITYQQKIDGYPLTAPLQNIASTICKWVALDNGTTSGNAIWYYEDVNKNVEACSNYYKRINNSGNPVIEDDNITRAFLGSVIFITKTKKGYENYFE